MLLTAANLTAPLRLTSLVLPAAGQTGETVEVHVQYASKNSFHTVGIARRLNGDDHTVVRPLAHRRFSTVKRS